MPLRLIAQALVIFVCIMSFGFSVGDFLAGAALAYNTYKALSDREGSSKQYRELIIIDSYTLVTSVRPTHGG